MATSSGTLVRTNEEPGTRARLKGLNTSPYKVREVLDLVRGQDIRKAFEILRFCDRGPAIPVAKLLTSAVANAVNNDELDRDELFVSACFADEGPTMKRFKAGSRGRSGRIRKRTSSVTIVVSRLPEERLARIQREQEEEKGSRRQRVAGSRAERVAKSKQTPVEDASAEAETPQVEDVADDSAVPEASEPTQTAVGETEELTEQNETKEDK